MVLFGGRKTREPGEKSLEQCGEPTINPNHFYCETLGPRFEPVPHGWEAPLPLCHPCSPRLNIRSCVLWWAHAMLPVTLYFVFVFIREAKENILYQSRTMNITPWQCGTGHERRKSPRPGYDLHLSTYTYTIQTIFVQKNWGIRKGKYLYIHFI